MSEADQIIKRLTSQRGVISILLLDSEGIPVRSTLEARFSQQYAVLLSQLAATTRCVVREIQPPNDLMFFKVKTKKFDIMIAPDREFMLIVIQASPVLASISSTTWVCLICSFENKEDVYECAICNCRSVKRPPLNWKPDPDVVDLPAPVSDPIPDLEPVEAVEQRSAVETVEVVAQPPSLEQPPGCALTPAEAAALAMVPTTPDTLTPEIELQMLNKEDENEDKVEIDLDGPIMPVSTLSRPGTGAGLGRPPTGGLLRPSTGGPSENRRNADAVLARLARRVPPRDFLPCFCEVARVRARRDHAKKYIAGMVVEGGSFMTTPRGTTKGAPENLQNIAEMAPWCRSAMVPESSETQYDDDGESSIAAAGRVMKRLSDCLLKMSIMMDDGNCLFRAAASQLLGTQDDHAIVREKAVSNMKSRRAELEEFFGSPEEFDEYITSMEADRTWGDELVLCAIAESYRCIVHVVTSHHENWYLVYTPRQKPKVGEGGAAAALEEVFLAYLAPVHYNAIVLDDDGTGLAAVSEDAVEADVGTPRST